MGKQRVNKRRSNGKRAPKVLEWQDLPCINRDAAGLDIHPEVIVACVPLDRDEEPIRSFGTFTPDLEALADWLQACGIKTVAMESTGVYWIALYEILEKRGIEVRVVNARQMKNVEARKGDMSDAQWLQTLHSYGLLGNSFLPDATWRPLRAYWRHRMSLVEHRAPHIQHMQKALVQMNLQLTQVLSDITGVTGMEIMRAIVAGERDAVKLAQLRDPRCKHSSDDIAKALTGNYRPEHIFALKQALELYDDYTEKIVECDAEMERQYATMQDATAPDGGPLPPLGPDPKKNSHAKNGPAFDLRAQLYRVIGVDLVAVSGLNESTVQSIISEIGTDMTRWRSVKHCCSWLGLAPHNDISAGKLLRSRTHKQHNRAGQAFRMAAESQVRSDTAFGAFYRRKAAQIGREQAIVATAHKIARTVYAILSKRVPFQEMGANEYDRQFDARVVAAMRKKARGHGFGLVRLELLEQLGLLDLLEQAAPATS